MFHSLSLTVEYPFWNKGCQTRSVTNFEKNYIYRERLIIKGIVDDIYDVRVQTKVKAYSCIYNGKRRG